MSVAQETVIPAVCLVSLLAGPAWRQNRLPLRRYTDAEAWMKLAKEASIIRWRTSRGMTLSNYVTKYDVTVT